MKSNNNSFLSRLVIVLVVLVVISWIGWLWWSDSIAPVDLTDTKSEIFVVKSGDGVKTIASHLAEQKFIRSPTGFYVLIKFLGIERQLQAGDFRLNRAMDAKTIAFELTHGIMDIWITIPEGWRVEEIATKVAKEFDIPEQEFLRYAREGYLFPDTYLIPRDATAAGIVRILQDNFENKLSEQIRADVAHTGLNLDQVITLASVVEREGNSGSDRPIIAGILLKRLKADWPLQTDATLQYALGYQALSKTWWKKELTAEDKEVASSYNTYSHQGLPPKPICNPGLESIRAVIYAQPTEYWYYIHDPKGVVHFAKTIEEHNANVMQYLQ